MLSSFLILNVQILASYWNLVLGWSARAGGCPVVVAQYSCTSQVSCMGSIPMQALSLSSIYFALVAMVLNCMGHTTVTYCVLIFGQCMNKL